VDIKTFPGQDRKMCKYIPFSEKNSSMPLLASIYSDALRKCKQEIGDKQQNCRTLMA
jgi:hypothetical protein